MGFKPDLQVLPGLALQALPQGVRHLNVESAVFEAMVRGWEAQQRARCLSAGTIAARSRLVRKLSEFSNQYPWQWTPAEWEAFLSSLGPQPRGLAHSSARSYAVDMRLFLDYLVDARYGWQAVCQEEFGDFPVQIVSELNAPTHVVDYEGKPGRRPLTYDEVQALFDATDGRVEEATRPQGGVDRDAGLGDAQDGLCVRSAPQ